MRLIKMLGLASVAAVAAMAFLGASSARAEFNTALCKSNTPLECAESNLLREFTMTAGTTVLKTSLVTILCLGSKINGEVETPGLLAHAPTPLAIIITALTWEKCGTNAEHSNCTFTNEKLPLLDMLKTAAGLGIAAMLNSEVHVVCPFINCYYGGAIVEGLTVESALHTEGTGHGMLTAKEITWPKVKGSFCPATSKWTALYEPTEHIYLKS